MTPEDLVHWKRVKDIFEEAADVPEADRAALLRRQCEGSAVLRAEVEDLLRLHGESNLTIDKLSVPRMASPIAAWAHMNLPLSRFEPGAVLANHYRIVRFIASGGMGEVYEAVHTETGIAVALKCMRLFAAGPGARLEERFLREANLISLIDHPNVCRVFEVIEEHSVLCFAMELLDGETLADRLARDGRYSAQEALPLTTQLCDGLDAAHHAGVLHRDLKPGNIFLSGGRPVIIDFGLAAGVASDHSLTSAGAVIGTLAYAAPEQLENGQCSAASDIYSLGVVLYEMLTGEKPHLAKSPFRLAAQKARESHKTPDVAMPGIPPVWHEVLDKCLKAKPEERFQSGSQIKALLERGRPSRGFLASKWTHRLMAPALAALALVAVWIGWTWRNRDYKPSAEAAALYERAQAALTEASPLRSSQLLERAVAADPQFVHARALLAVAYSEIDQLDQSRDAVLQATTIANNRWFLGRAEALSLDGARAVITRDYKIAAGHYQRLADSAVGRERANALLALARVHEQLANPDDALKALAAVLHEDGSNWAAHVRHAMLLCRKREYEKAGPEFRAAELAYVKSGNLEGLSDLLLARSATLRIRGAETDRKDLERILELSAKTGNRYHNLSAKFRLAGIATLERDYDLASKIAREAVDQARSENLQGVAAGAMSQYCYTFALQRRYDLAEPCLREAVKLAERANSQSVLAHSRMKLGEVLVALKKQREGIAVMEPAIQWFRQAKYDSFPLMLVKWGTALGYSSEGEKAFEEALELSANNGEEMYQSMALQRLLSRYQNSDLRKAAILAPGLAVLSRKANNHGSILAAASALLRFGDWSQAEALIAEAERIISGYPPGSDRQSLSDHARTRRATMSRLRQGDCNGALRLLAQREVNKGDRAIRQMQACSAVTTPLQLRQNLAWFESQIATWETEDHPDRSVDHALAGDTALALKDWTTAKAHAERGIQEAASGYHLFASELDNTLILRVAEHKLGNHAAVAPLSARILQLSAQLGLDPPEKFNARQDLLRLWRMVP